MTLSEAAQHLREMAEESAAYLDNNPVEHGVAETMRLQALALLLGAEACVIAIANDEKAARRATTSVIAQWGKRIN